MKILTVNNTADCYGASRCMERVFCALAEAGHEVHAVLPEEGSLATLLRARGVVVHLHPRLPVIDRNLLKTVAGCLRFAAFLPPSMLFLSRLIVSLRIDVVHTNTVVIPSPSLAAWITRRPHVWHVRELLADFGSLWRPYQRWVCGLSAAVVAISCCVRDQFAPHLQRGVRIVYDGLDESAGVPDFAAVKAFRTMFPPNATLIGVVGRIKWHRKGQEVLVRAAALLKARFPCCHYAVVGKPSPGNEEQEQRLRALVAEHGLGDVVHLMGEIEDTASVFAALDVAVVPSVQMEPFGCVVIEAMATGTAVVGSRAGGIAEQIVEGRSGLLFAPGDAEELALQLGRLLEDAALRERLSAEGERHVRSEFRLQSTISDMTSLFGSLAGEAAGSAGVRMPRNRALPVAMEAQNGSARELQPGSEAAIPARES